MPGKGAMIGNGNIRAKLLSEDEKDDELEAGRSRQDSIIIQVPTEHSLLAWARGDPAELREALKIASERRDEHMLTLPQLAGLFKTHLDPEKPAKSKGHSSEAALRILAMTGSNTLSPQPSTPAWLLFLNEFTNPLNMMLICAALLSFMIYPIEDESTIEPLELGGVLIFVTFMNALIDFVEHQKAEKVLKAFGNLVPSSQVVIRDGERQLVDPVTLVMGDVVALQSGDKVPADVRFIMVNNIKVDNSSLTGESDPLIREAVARTDHPLEAENIGFFGTTVVNGAGIAVVIRTGDATTMGQIAASAGRGRKKESPLSLEITHFVKMTAVVASVTGVVFFAAGMAIKPSFLINFVFFIGIFVAFVPQGLPATVTMLLTFAAQRLKEINVLVKDLQAVDTLGTITLLASDKTGTMTMNRMTVVDMWINMEAHSTEDRAKPFEPANVPNADSVLQCFMLCSNARYAASKTGEAQREIIGDATETGLLRFAAQYYEPISYRDEHPQVLDVPFDSTKKWALSINTVGHDAGELTLFIKGAPERVLRMCSSAAVNGKQVPVDSAFSQAFNQAYERMAGQGERVIAMAVLKLPRGKYAVDFEFSYDNYPTGNYTFVGLVGLRDPPKPGVAQAVTACGGAGVQVVMVTGDHPLTAEAIARQVGIIKGDTRVEAAARLMVGLAEVEPDEYDAVVVHGDNIDAMDNDMWIEILNKKEIVFARTSPQHKLEIVTRFQAMGHVVGVTGDGVNDSPALKRSDMGISMAITGSDVSKEAASIILMDDNFASVVEGIKEGRLIFNNLKKSIMYTLTHIIPEVMPFLLYIVVGIPVPINSFLILCIDLCTEIGPALSFAWEFPEDDIMQVAPRRFVKPLSPAVVANRSEVTDLEKIKGFEIREVDINEAEHQPVAHRLGFFWFRFMQWKVKDKNPEDETLVDAFVFQWSYLQGGMIEASFALIAYFWEFYFLGLTPADLYGAARNYFTSDAGDYTLESGVVLSADTQVYYLYKAQSAYFVTMVGMQCFTAYVTKVRRGMPWGRKFFKNLRTYAACCFSLTMATIIVLTPGLHNVLQARPFDARVLFVPVCGGLFLIMYEAVRRSLFPDAGFVNRARMQTIRRENTLRQQRTSRRNSAGSIESAPDGHKRTSSRVYRASSRAKGDVV